MSFGCKNTLKSYAKIMINGVSPCKRRKNYRLLIYLCVPNGTDVGTMRHTWHIGIAKRHLFCPYSMQINAKRPTMTDAMDGRFVLGCAAVKTDI